MRSDLKLSILASAIAAFPAFAQADEPAPYANMLTGDWGGWRSQLHNDGVDLSFGYTTETATNVQGGTKQQVLYTDQLAFGAALDLSKLLSLENARLQITITDRNGTNLSSAKNLDTLQLVQEVYGRGQTWRITQFWYDQTYFNNLLDWKIGRLTVGEDSASFTCYFQNLTFCGAQPGNLVGSYWYNWPVSQWGSRLKANVPSFGYVQVAAYEVNPSYLTREYALYPFDPPGATGALIPAEIGWLPTFGQLTGSYKFGAWYNTSNTADAAKNTQGQLLLLFGGQPLQRDGAYGAYVSFVQQLTNPSPGRGLSAFFNWIVADRRTATTDSQIAGGMTYQGPFDIRPQDDIALAFGRTHVNDRVTEAEELQNGAGLGPVPVQHSEYVTELYYTFHVTDWLNLRPNFQYIHQPGGINRTDDIILGLKTTLTF
jgi:porin